nr:hypothetical protein [Streptosporangium minutum]
MGHQIERAELIHAEDDVGLTLLGCDLTIGDRVEVFHAGLLGCVVRIAGGLPGLQALKRDAFLVEQDARALVADVVDYSLSDQELRQLGQAPGRERQVMLGRLRLGDLLDLAPPPNHHRPGAPADDPQSRSPSASSISRKRTGAAMPAYSLVSRTAF